MVAATEEYVQEHSDKEQREARYEKVVAAIAWEQLDFVADTTGVEKGRETVTDTKKMEKGDGITKSRVVDNANQVQRRLSMRGCRGVHPNRMPTSKVCHCTDWSWSCRT